MSVIHRIIISVRIQNQYRIKFKTFGISHRQYHNSIRKNCSLQTTLRNRNPFSKLLCGFPGTLLTAAYHCDCTKSLFLPLSTNGSCLSYQCLIGRNLPYAHRLPMTDDRFCRISRKASVMQDFQCKFRNLYCVSIALFQHPEAVHFIG